MSALPATSAPARPATRQTLDTIEGTRALHELANIFTNSSLVPKDFQRNQANCIIALDIAARLNLSPMMVFQQLYIVNGKPSWSSAFMISMFNERAKAFDRLEYCYSGQKNTPDRTCWCRAKLKATGEYVDGPPVTLRMAKAEGWGKKWDSMPELMLKYRAAAFFIRTNCPEILFGLYSAEESQDIVAAESTRTNARVVARPGEPAPSPTQKLLQCFAAWNISQDTLEDYLGHSMDTVSEEEMMKLREVWKEIKRTDGAVVLDIFPSLAGGPADVRDAEPVQVVEEKKETVSTPEAALAQSQEQPKAPVEQSVPTQQPAPSPAPKLSKEELRAKHIEHFNEQCKRHSVPSRVMIALFKELVPRVQSNEDAMAELGSDDRNFQDVLRQVKARRPDNAPQQAQAVNA